MAYTTFQKEFWSDDYVLELNKDQKLVYVYIITNEKTTQCGIYELPLKKATTELSMSAEEFLIHLKKFNDDKKIQYSLETQEICVINWLKHNENSSWKTMERVKKELSKIKNPNLVVLLYDPRKPLFDGFRKKNMGNKQYVEEPHRIDNPWNELFKELSDEILQEIREPFLKYAPLMPLLCPIGAPSKGYLPYTNTLHNITNSESYTNSKAETVEQSPTGKDFTPPPPYKPKEKFQSFLNCWNELIPKEAIDIALNLSIDTTAMNFIETTEFSHYRQCVENYGKAYGFNSTRMSGFLSSLTPKFIMNWYNEQSIENCRQRSEISKPKSKKPIFDLDGSDDYFPDGTKRNF